VCHGTERAAAAQAVAGLAGVRNVWNDIEISYDIEPGKDAGPRVPAGCVVMIGSSHQIVESSDHSCN
jgi:hypothetical protein